MEVASIITEQLDRCRYKVGKDWALNRVNDFLEEAYNRFNNLFVTSTYISTTADTKIYTLSSIAADIADPLYVYVKHDDTGGGDYNSSGVGDFYPEVRFTATQLEFFEDPGTTTSEFTLYYIPTFTRLANSGSTLSLPNKYRHYINEALFESIQSYLQERMWDWSDILDRFDSEANRQHGIQTLKGYYG